MINVAVHTSYTQFLGNRLFQLADGIAANRESSERYHALKRFFEAKGVNLSTYDLFDSGTPPDVWLFIDPPADIIRFMMKRRINPRKSILLMVEPPVGNPSLYRHSWLFFRLFGLVLSWNTDLCKKRNNFRHWFLPYGFDEAASLPCRSSQKTNLCVMMHSNKSSLIKGELYSYRREVVRYFEGRGDNLLDLYGSGWNDESSPNPFITSLHKGWFDDKRQCISSYWFCLCIDNSIIPGYITYDPFISMSIGTVPVYLPMPDALEYIPRDTFVNMNDFASLADLTDYLVQLKGTAAYEKLLQNGRDFLASKQYRPFTVDKFCEDIYDAVKVMISRNVR